MGRDKPLRVIENGGLIMVEGRLRYFHKVGCGERWVHLMWIFFGAQCVLLFNDCVDIFTDVDSLVRE